MRCRFLRSSHHRMYHKQCPRASHRAKQPRHDVVQLKIRKDRNWDRCVGRHAPTGASVSLVRWFQALLHLLDQLIDAEARWPLTGRKLLKGGQKWSHDGLRREEWRRSIRHEEVVEGVRGNVRALVRVRAQVEDFRDAELGERLGPDSQRALRTLLLEHDLPVFIAHGDEVAIVVEVEELFPGAARLLAREIGKLIKAVEMDLEGFACGL